VARVRCEPDFRKIPSSTLPRRAQLIPLWAARPWPGCASCRPASWSSRCRWKHSQKLAQIDQILANNQRQAWQNSRKPMTESTAEIRPELAARLARPTVRLSGHWAAVPPRRRQFNNPIFKRCSLAPPAAEPTLNTTARKWRAPRAVISLSMKIRICAVLGGLLIPRSGGG
jgi:hypothetical protein